MLINMRNKISHATHGLKLYSILSNLFVLFDSNSEIHKMCKVRYD